MRPGITSASHDGMGDDRGGAHHSQVSHLSWNIWICTLIFQENLLRRNLVIYGMLFYIKIYPARLYKGKSGSVRLTERATRKRRMKFPVSWETWKYFFLGVKSATRVTGSGASLSLVPSGLSRHIHTGAGAKLHTSGQKHCLSNHYTDRVMC